MPSATSRITNSSGHRARPTMNWLSGARPSMIERQRKRHHRADHQQQCGDAAGGERQREQVQADETALFPLLIDDVEGVDHRLDAGIGAPDREPEAEQEGRAKRGVALVEHPRDLVLHDLERALRQHQRQRLQIGADGRGIGEQAVAGDQRGDRRKHREQAEEHHAGGGGEQAVFAGPHIGAPQNILPAGPGDLQRAAGKPATAVLGEFTRETARAGGRRTSKGENPVSMAMFGWK